MKKILLTGGNGFIGKNIRESYLDGLYEITAPRSFELNLADTESVDDFFKKNEFDAVIHAAVKPGHRNAKDKSNLFYTNFRMFENLERNKDRYGKFINIGSGAIYDTSKDITNACETDILKRMPLDEHGFCKYTVHKMIEMFDNFVDLNIFGIFGKYEDWEIRFISNAICKTIFGLPITLRQNRRFSYLYIDDLMPVLEFFIENDVKYKSYNIVPDEKVELKQIGEIITKLSPVNSELIIAKDGMGTDYTGSNKRLRNEMPDVCFTNIEQSVCKLYNYYQTIKHDINKELLLKDK